MMSNDIQGDDEFRSYITDFESYLHNIGSEVRRASPDAGLSEAMTSSVENYEHSEEGGTWNHRQEYLSTDDDLSHARYEDDRYYGSKNMERIDEREDQDAERSCQQQPYTDDSGDTVSRSDDEQHEYQINEPVDQTSVIETPPQTLDTEQQLVSDRVPQDDTMFSGVQRSDAYSERQSYDNDDDNDDYEEADRYKRVDVLQRHHEVEQQNLDSEKNYQDQLYHESQQSYQEEQCNALDVDYQDHRYHETENGYREHLYGGPENNCQDPDRREVDERGERSNYDSQDTSNVYQYDEQQSNETGLVQHYSESIAYGDTATDVREEHQFYNERNASETDSDYRLAKHEEDVDRNACYSQQYIDECQLRGTDEYREVKFSVDNGNKEARYNDVRRTWEDDEQERRHGSEEQQTSAGYNNDDEQNQNDEHPVAERGRIKVLLAQWRQFEQQMAPSSGATRQAASRDSHIRSRSCGPTRRRDPVSNIYENKCSDDIATEININGRRSRWTDEDEEDESHTVNRAAILAKFENIEAQAHKTAIVTKKKEFKWSVKETTTLGRPVGLRFTS